MIGITLVLVSMYEEFTIMNNASGNVPITVIIPTLNEEKNIVDCFESVCHWASEVVVIDAGSNDDTVNIAKQYTPKVYTHSFGKHQYTKQKNWALTDLSLKNEWVLLLDADERIMPDLQKSIAEVFASSIPDSIAGFTINIRLVFLGRPIKHGAYAPNWALRLFHRERVRFVDVGGLDYAQANGETIRLRGLVMHYDRKDLTAWISKQNERSSLEALAIYNPSGAETNRSNLAKVERRGKTKTTLWARLPLLLRPVLLFVYGYFIRGGFLDGKQGFIYSFLMSWWYRLLVDAKYIELQQVLDGNISRQQGGNIV